MTKVLIEREFNSDDRNPNVNGSKRLLHVAQLDGTHVRVLIQGVQGTALSTRLVTLSDVTLDLDVWNAHKELILKGLE